MQEDCGTQNGGDERKFVLTRREVFIILAIGAVIFAGYVVYDLNGHSFDPTDRQMIIIVSDSMDGDVHEYDVDSFKKNTMVMVRHLSDSEKKRIEVGDVLSFWYEGVLDHHRVIDISHIGDENPYVITKGDNTEKYHSEETVYLKDINGEVVGTNHALGVVASFVKDHFLIMLAVIALFAIAGELVSYSKNKEKGDDLE